MNRNNQDFYVYTYRCPNTQTPVYVGKGSGNRAYKHLKSTHNRKFSLFICNLLYQGKLPIIDIQPQETEEKAFEEEIRLIALYGRLDKKKGTLFNRTDGGKVVPEFKRTPKYRKNLSTAMKGNKNAKDGNQCGTIQNHSKESKMKISESQKARWAKIKENKK